MDDPVAVDRVKSDRRRVLMVSAAKGAAAGLIGVAAMTLAEKVEQALSGRPSSYVPARTLRGLLGRRTDDAEQPAGWNHAMHWSTGAVLGALRGIWAVVGIRGVTADVAHTVVRLASDQTLENATGVGAPPTTWPRGELVVDVVHKAIYSFVTGAVGERLIRPALVSDRGAHSH